MVSHTQEPSSMPSRQAMAHAAFLPEAVGPIEHNTIFDLDSGFVGGNTMVRQHLVIRVSVKQLRRGGAP